MRLSVIMPARNAERYIRRAISSTLYQMPLDSELLVLDDSSEDETGSIISEFTRIDSRVSLFSNSGQARGVALALNSLLDEASGVLVARMDADDICIRKRFDWQMSYLSSSRRDFVAGYAVNFGRTPRDFWPRRPLSISGADCGRILLDSNPFAHSTVMYRRSVVRSMDGYRADCLAEDYDLWLRMACAGVQLCQRPLPAVFYRKHTMQATKDSIWQTSVANDRGILELRRQLERRFVSGRDC